MVFAHRKNNKKIRTKTHFTAGITPVQKPNFSTDLLEKQQNVLQQNTAGHTINLSGYIAGFIRHQENIS